MAEEEYDKSLEYYKEAIKLDPRFVDAYIQAGIAAMELGQVAEATSYHYKASQFSAGIHNQLHDYSTNIYEGVFPPELNGLISDYLVDSTQPASVLGLVNTLDLGLQMVLRLIRYLILLSALKLQSMSVLRQM